MHFDSTPSSPTTANPPLSIVHRFTKRVRSCIDVATFTRLFPIARCGNSNRLLVDKYCRYCRQPQCISTPARIPLHQHAELEMLGSCCNFPSAPIFQSNGNLGKIHHKHASMDICGIASTVPFRHPKNLSVPGSSINFLDVEFSCSFATVFYKLVLLLSVDS